MAQGDQDEQHLGTLVRINLSGEPTTSYTGAAANLAEAPARAHLVTNRLVGGAGSNDAAD